MWNRNIFILFVFWDLSWFNEDIVIIISYLRFDLSLILLLFFCILNFLFYFIRNLCLLWGLRDTNFLNIGLEIFRHTQLQLLYWWLFFLILFGHYIFCYFYSFTFTLIPFVFYLNFALGWNLFWFALSNTFLLGS